MFTLIKLAIDLFVAAAFFILGIKFQSKFPAAAAKINSFLSWAKSQA